MISVVSRVFWIFLVFASLSSNGFVEADLVHHDGHEEELGPMSDGEDVYDFVVDEIYHNDVMVFAKSYCPYCRKTRLLLEELHAEFEGWHLKVLDLDLMEGDDGALVQHALMELTGQRTVPNVFIGEDHIGGNDDLQQMHAEGRLLPLLEEISISDEM